MVKLKSALGYLICFFVLVMGANAAQEQILVELNEYIDQNVLYNPLKAKSGDWTDANEIRSSYTATGYIIVSNSNTAEAISDIYINFSYTGNITAPVHYTGRVGTFLSNNTSSGNILLHIPELRVGENSTWQYLINTSVIRPPLNITSNYSVSKILTGDNISVTDTIENVFDNISYQTDTCIYDINITQATVPINFSGDIQNWTYYPAFTTGSDSGNVTYVNANTTQYWNALGGGCLYKTNTTDITYRLESPTNAPTSTYYYFINSSLTYRLNQTISHLKVEDISAISQATLEFDKTIIGPAHPTLYGSNVTWNITGFFNTDTNITYNLTSATFWVSVRNYNGSYTDPNQIDVDPINNSISLNTIQNPNVLVNKTTPWTSTSWLFNYSDIPSPIVWLDLNFTMYNDGTQMVNRSVTRNGNDIYIKEVYLIVGYWLEIDKNITSIAADTYRVKIDVHNKGNRHTPADTVVTIYDFIPSNFANSSQFVFSSSPWYNTTAANNPVNGQYNGTLYQWGLVPDNSYNTSFAPGPGSNENTTWSVIYNVTGSGDYTLLDVFITGLDPQQVDGAGSSKAVIVSEILERIKSTEGIFAAVASLLLLVGLLL